MESKSESVCQGLISCYPRQALTDYIIQVNNSQNIFTQFLWFFKFNLKGAYNDKPFFPVVYYNNLAGMFIFVY